MDTTLYKSLHWVIVSLVGLILAGVNPAHAQETLYNSGYQEGTAYMRDGTLRTGLFAVQLLRSEDRDTDGNASVTEEYKLVQQLQGGSRNGQPYYRNELIKQKTVDRLVFRNGYELRRVGNGLARVVLRTAQLTLLEDHPGFNQRIHPDRAFSQLLVSDGLTATRLSKPKQYKAWLQKQALQMNTPQSVVDEPTALDVFRAVLRQRLAQTTIGSDTIQLADGKRLLGQVLDVTPEQISYRIGSQPAVHLYINVVSELHFQQGGVLCFPNPTELEELAVQAAIQFIQTPQTQDEIVREDSRLGLLIFGGYGTSANVGLSPFRIQGFGNFGIQKQFFWPLSNRLLPVVGAQLISLPYRQDPTHVSDMLGAGVYLGLMYRLSNRPLAPELKDRRYWWVSPRLGAYHASQTYLNDALLPLPDDEALPTVTQWLVSPGVTVGYRRGTFRVGLGYNYLPARPIQGLSYQSNYYDVTFFKEPQHHLSLQLSLGF